MPDYLREVEKRGLNLFQMHEVREGLKNLTTDQVDIYAWPKYDHLQMQEIRLGLEHGLTEEEMSVFLDPNIGYKQMNYNRIKIENSNVINEKAETELRKKKYLNAFIAVSVIAVIICGSYAGWYFQDFLKAKFQNLELKLTGDTVTLGYGDVFDPMDYVESYTMEDGVELILPEPLNTEMIGEQTAVYKLKNPQKTVTAELKVVIIDDEAPVIVLNAKEVTLVRMKDEFSFKEFLSSAYDAVDGDLTDQVVCSETDSSLDEQIAVYAVADSAGNRCEAELVLHFEDPVIPETPEPVIIIQEVPVESGEGSSGYAHSENNPSSGNIQTYDPPVQESHGTQNFMFSDGYDMDSGYSACIAEGEKHGSYSCEPILNDDGIYTGYRLNY